MPSSSAATEWVSSSLPLIPPRSLLDELPIRATLAAWQHRLAGGCWAAWLDGLGDSYRDEGISGSLGRQKRPGLDVELAPGGSPISGWDWIASG